jgi:hypothetical protein
MDYANLKTEALRAQTNLTAAVEKQMRDDAAEIARLGAIIDNHKCARCEAIRLARTLNGVETVNLR